jgi:restriction system protein
VTLRCTIDSRQLSAAGNPDRVRLLVLLGTVLCVLSLKPQVAEAQDAAKTYYHVQQVTTGCQNPAAVRLLTNPDETARADARRLKSVRSSGRCVTITPRSQWTFLWQENDMAMMSYAGTIGRPGSYYLRIDELVDVNGQHPGEAAPAEPSGTSPAPAAAGSAANRTASAPPPAPSAESSEAPALLPQTQPPTAAPDTSINALIAKTNNAPPLATTSPGRAAGEPLDSPAHIWVPIIAGALFAAALAGFLVLRRRQGRSDKYAPALDIALDEILAQAAALRAAKSDSMRPDRYGTMHPDGWEREKTLFVQSRISARLHEGGYQDMLPALMPAIDAEIERQANASVEPTSFASDAGGTLAYRAAAAPEIDPDLSTFATRCTSLLQNAGWKTEPGSAGTGKAIDILAERDGHKLLLQCKGGGAPVGVEAVQQVFALKDRRRIDVAAIVTHAPFTRAAQQMASANGVHALNDDGLMQLIE